MCSVSLALDTSSVSCYAAVAEADGKITSGEIVSKSAPSHSESLSQLISKVLKASKVEVGSLGAIIVGLGPGSFTGLRIGLSFAKGLSLALRVPLFGIDSLEGAAYPYLKRTKSVVVLSPAGRNRYFAGIYCRTDECGFELTKHKDIYTLMPPCELRIENLKEKIVKVLSPLGVRLSGRPTSTEGGDVLCVCGGEGASINNIETEIGLGVVPPRNVASGLLMAFNAGYTEGDFALEEIVGLEPNYVQKVKAKSLAERGL